MGGSKLVMSLRRISSAYGGGDVSEISAAIATSYGNGEVEPLGGEDMEAPVGREVGKLDTSSGGEVERPVWGELETPGGGGIETSGDGELVTTKGRGFEAQVGEESMASGDGELEPSTAVSVMRPVSFCGLGADTGT